MPPRWLTFSVFTIVLWGLWGFIGKLSDTYAPVNGWVLQAYMTLGLLPSVLIAFASPGGRAGTFHPMGAAIAFITGVLGSIANSTTYVAFTLHGPASIILPIQAVYPILTTIAAAIVLRERVNTVQLLGIVVGIAGVVILSAAAAGGTGSTFVESLKSSWREPWMILTLIALVAQAVAGVTQKMCTNRMTPERSFIYFATAFIPVALGLALVAWLMPNLEWSFANHGWSIGGKPWLVCLGVGLTCGLGVLASFVAYRDGTASVVTALTGLYPAFTAVLAVVILHEKSNVYTWTGTLLALAGAAAMSYETKTKPQPAGFPVVPAPLAEAERV